MLSPRVVTLSAVVLLGLSLVLPASEAAAWRAGQPAVKASRLNDDATKDLRDIVKDVDKNRQQKSNTRR